MAFFRLPALRHDLLTTILPPGESRYKHVRDWNLPWSLQTSSLREALLVRADSQPQHGLRQRASWLPQRMSLHGGGYFFSKVMASATAPELTQVDLRTPLRPPLQMSASASATADAVISGSGVGGDRPLASDEIDTIPLREQSMRDEGSVLRALSGNGHNSAGGIGGGISGHGGGGGSSEHELLGASASSDQWSQLWSARGVASYASAQTEKALGGKYWRERLRKRGHCFFLFLEHWMRHAGMAMGMQPGEELAWKEVRADAAPPLLTLAIIATASPCAATFSAALR